MKNRSSLIFIHTSFLLYVLLITQKEYEEALKVLNDLKRARLFRSRAQYLRGYLLSELDKCAEAQKEIRPSTLDSQEIMVSVFDVSHMYAVADCAYKAGNATGAIAFLEKAKEQKITDREKARINYLISEYGGAYTMPPAGSKEEELNYFRRSDKGLILEIDSFGLVHKKYKN